MGNRGADSVVEFVVGPRVCSSWWLSTVLALLSLREWRGFKLRGLRGPRT